MSYNTTPLVLRSGVRPNWLDDGRFWYRITTEKGSEAFLVDAVKRTKAGCDLPQCSGGRGADPEGQPAATGRGRGGAGQRNDIPSPDGKRPHSCASTICGCATLPAARRRSSRPTA